MKKLVFMLLMLAPLLANAQSDPATKARVADVRAAYKQALADINAVQKGEEGAQNDALVSMRLNRPDSGATSETLEFYAEVKQDTVAATSTRRSSFVAVTACRLASIITSFSSTAKRAT